MSLVTLRDLYVAELQTLYDAEQQALQELPGFAARATSTELRVAFEEHYEETQLHLERLHLLLRQLDERPRHQGEGIRGLMQEGHRRAAEAERGEVLDAVLIATARRVEHYELAGYRSARSYAATLGDATAVRLLEETIEEERRLEERLTQLGDQRVQAAGDTELPQNVTTYRSRLRYVAAADVLAPDLAGLPVTNSDHDPLGTLDGFIVDGRTGRPLYYVVDSGGWFSGRRYVIPVAQLRRDGETPLLHTELTREQLRRYPEFSPSAFMAMTDGEAARYERRLLEAVLPFRHQVERAWERPGYEELPAYNAPDWLQTGTWVTESTGFAVTPPRSAPTTWSAHDEALRESGEAPPPGDPNSPEHANRSEGERLVAREESGRETEPNQGSGPDARSTDEYRQR
jgi:ferritin-like metal-binding protein YciE